MRILTYLFLLNISLFSNSLFISEYVESIIAQDTYIEIYNGTDSPIDLSEYFLKITRSTGSEYDLTLNNDSGDSNNNGLLDSWEVLLIIKNESSDLFSIYLDCIENNIQFIIFYNP